MNKKLKLALLASPTIFTSLLSMVAVVNPAHAYSPVIRMKDGEACIRHPHVSYNKFVCMRGTQTNHVSRSTSASQVNPAQPSNKNIPMLNFTEAESDQAIALFGCDCPYCMNALRALQNQAPMVY
ncbi:MAG: hypothetical protein DSM106950_17240 [Stigonema ocellatum SAG 48.90 = DSM 106950]|nr:hypothetical protein [Stigonema ocellatum SAG 48.90 = DSM 106950]